MIAGASTSCFYPLETEKSLKKVCELGFKKAEVFFNAECELKKDFVSELNCIKDGYGTEIVSVHPHSSFMETQCLFSDYERRFFDILPLYERYFEVCRELGAALVVLHGAHKRTKIPIPDERYFERFNILAEKAKANGVVLAQENVNLFKSESIEFLKRMRSETGDNFHLVFDIKQTIRAKQDTFEFLNEFKNDICHVHLSDNNSERDCLPLGRGVFDIKKTENILNKANYNGNYVIEIYSSGFDVEKELILSKNYLDNL